jgi:hypothetical protein
MATKKISELTTLATINDNVQVPIVDTSTTKKATWSVFKANNGDALQKASDVADKVNFDSDTSAPGSAPTKTGDRFVNTSDKDAYVAVGTGATADWRKVIHGDADGNFEIPANKQLYFEAMKTITAPTGTTFTMNFNDGNVQFVDLEAVTGNVTASFSNPKVGTYILIVEHDSTARTLTFPTAYLVGVTGTSTTAFSMGAGGTFRTMFTIAYDGTNYYITETKFHA